MIQDIFTSYAATASPTCYSWTVPCHRMQRLSAGVRLIHVVTYTDHLHPAICSLSLELCILIESLTVRSPASTSPCSASSVALLCYWTCSRFLTRLSDTHPSRLCRMLAWCCQVICFSLLSHGMSRHSILQSLCRTCNVFD